MSLASFQQRLAKDLQKSWQKTALLGLLLVVGLAVWIPPLLKNSNGPGKVPATPVVDSNVAAGGRLEAAVEGSTTSLGWADVDQIVERDPLLQTADMAALTTDPFELDRDRFPPPILFAENEPEVDSPLPEPVQAVDPEVPQTLVLKSTFLSRSRKAAYINRKLYFEGMQIQDGDRWWKIESIQPRRVILVHGSQRHTLVIESPAYDVSAAARKSGGDIPGGGSATQ